MPEQSSSSVVNFAVPAYGSVVSAPFFESFHSLSHLLHQRRIPHSLSLLGNDSLVPRARNTLVARFLAEPRHTHLMFVDSDIQFRAQDVLRLLEHTQSRECAVVAAGYQTKALDWTRAVETVSQGIRDPRDIQSLSARFAVRLPPAPRTRGNGLIEAAEVGAGFMLIRRDAIERLQSAYPELAYDSDTDADAGVRHHALFDTGIDGRPPLDRWVEKPGRYLSEDYYFCRLWRQIDGVVWLDPSVELVHHGTFAYAGSIARATSAGR